MMYTLFKYELKKLVKKKSILIAFIGLFLCIGALSMLFIGECTQIDETGSRVKGLEAIALHKKQVAEFEGALTAQKMVSTLEKYQGIINDPANYTSLGAEDRQIRDEVYGREIQKHEDILDLLRRVFSPAGIYDYYVLSTVRPQDAETFYEQRAAKVAEILDMEYSTGNYTEAEKVYILQMNDEIQVPFHFAYTQGWSDMLTRGFLSILLMVSFVVCICISPVFANEYQTGADSIILSSKYGKSKVITAKLLSSFVLTTGLYSAALLFFTLLMLGFHGTTGWNASFQIASFTSPYPLTMLQVYAYGSIIGYMVVLSIMAINLLFSAILKTPFAVFIIGALWVFVPMFIPSSMTSAWLNRIFALLPAKAMDAFTLFSAYSPYNLLGKIISLPTAITIFSTCITLTALLAARSRFKGHQVA